MKFFLIRVRLKCPGNRDAIPQLNNPPILHIYSVTFATAFVTECLNGRLKTRTC
jgi:hypothetical protein